MHLTVTPLILADSFSFVSALWVIYRSRFDRAFEKQFRVHYDGAVRQGFYQRPYHNHFSSRNIALAVSEEINGWNEVARKNVHFHWLFKTSSIFNQLITVF